MTNTMLSVRNYFAKFSRFGRTRFRCWRYVQPTSEFILNCSRRRKSGVAVKGNGTRLLRFETPSVNAAKKRDRNCL